MQRKHFSFKRHENFKMSMKRIGAMTHDPLKKITLLCGQKSRHTPFHICRGAMAVLFDDPRSS
ncbi:hypothetical protein MHBO_002906 [Bonamia ostreae]|uniref:Uncharacterized protein n=1 Tax=Bonamia ostreae TaxID=126728 RepID=A0ABV2ANX2_9EUKA